MSTGSAAAGEYVVPTYRAPDGVVWYHVLHGSVPGHQIDYILRPELPQGDLKQQHFIHLSRSLKYIEPCHGSDFAFALVNLSRDDTQHEPGRGGVGIILGLRVRGAKDHAGRPDPPFSHAIVSVGRALDRGLLEETALSFYSHVLGGKALDGNGTIFYKAFAASAKSSPNACDLISRYIGTFADLPRPARGAATHIWQAGGSQLPRRVVILHESDVPFSMIARSAARIAAMLYRSDIRWTSITTGREGDIPNGVSIRIVSRQAAKLIGLLRGEAGDRVIHVEDVPEREEDIARELFGAALVQQYPRGSPALPGGLTQSSAAGDRVNMKGNFIPSGLETADADTLPLPQLEIPEKGLAANAALESGSAESLPDRASANPLPSDKSFAKSRRITLVAATLLAFAAAAPAAHFLFQNGKTKVEPEGNDAREPAAPMPPRAPESAAVKPPRVPEPTQAPPLIEHAATAEAPPTNNPANAMASPPRVQRPAAARLGSTRIGTQRPKPPEEIASEGDLFGNPNIARPKAPDPK